MTGTTGSGEHPRLDALLAEAQTHPVSGWDFSWLGDRFRESEAPWDFPAIVSGYLVGAERLLDMGTGGGERLTALPNRPTRTVATEGWPPNVAVAQARLGPLGVEVVAAGGGPDNVRQPLTAIPPAPGEDGALPFPDGAFDVIVNRHESFIAAEVARLLRSGGTFVTQQVGNSGYAGYRAAMGLPPEPREVPLWTLTLAMAQVEAAGLAVVTSAEFMVTQTFADAGALGWYLRMVPWVVPGFSVDGYRGSLGAAQPAIERDGPLAFDFPVFWLAARAR